MTDKQLKKLKRVELLELLVEQGAELEEVRRRLEEAEAALESRTLRLQDAGTMAEAALRLNDIFAAADRAAQDYLDGVRALRDAEELLLDETRAKCRAMEENLGAHCPPPPEANA